MTSYALSYPLTHALSYSPANALLGGAGIPVTGLPIQDESGNNILDENNLTITG